MNRFLSMYPSLALAVALGFLASCDSSSDLPNGESPLPEDTVVTPSGTTGSTIPWNSSISYGTLTDSRDGKVYRTVSIDARTWMAENLNYAADSSWWYANSADSGSKYGRLYTWAAAMNLSDLCNRTRCAAQVQTRHQGVCPTGWHLPSDAEWMMLIDDVGGQSGMELKSSTGWSDSSGDSYGFRALPAGDRDKDGRFNSVGRNSSFWSASEYDADFAWRRYLSSGYGDMARHSKTYGFSVRCLKD